MNLTSTRECGLRLLEISGIYERGVIRYEAGAGILSIAGLVARQRRLLRAAYELADKGHRLEASILQRAMLEFLIRQKWLEGAPKLNYLLWVADDLRGRLRIDRELRERFPDEHGSAIEVMEPDIREAYERDLENLNAELEQIRAELQIEKVPEMPSLHDQAIAVGLGFSYSMAYRIDSQSAAHPTALAIEQLLENVPELGGIRLLAEPSSERIVDTYSVCAAILRDALASAAALIPELRLEGFDEVSAALDVLEELMKSETAENGSRGS